MNLRKFKLMRLSVCTCGYGVLDDSITEGTEYSADLDTVATMYYRCGRCGLDQNLVTARCSQVLNPERPRAPLPLALFTVAHKICPTCGIMYDATDEFCSLYRLHAPNLRAREHRQLRPATDREETNFVRFA